MCCYSLLLPVLHVFIITNPVHKICSPREYLTIAKSNKSVVLGPEHIWKCLPYLSLQETEGLSQVIKRIQIS